MLRAVPFRSSAFIYNCKTRRNLNFGKYIQCNFHNNFNFICHEKRFFYFETDSDKKRKIDLIKPTQEIYRLLKNNDLHAAENLFYSLLQQYKILNLQTYTSILAGYAKIGDVKKSSEVLQLMKEHNIQMDSKVINKHLACLSKSKKQMELLDYFEKNFELCDCSSGYIIIDYYAQHQMVDEARAFFERNQMQLNLDEKEFTKLLLIRIPYFKPFSDYKIFAKNFLEDALQNGLLNSNSFNHALRIAGDLRDFTLILTIISKMEEDNIQPDFELQKRMQFLFRGTPFGFYDWHSMYQHLTPS